MFHSFKDAHSSSPLDHATRSIELQLPPNADITITVEANPAWRHDIIIRVSDSAYIFTHDPLRPGHMSFYRPYRSEALKLDPSPVPRPTTFTFAYHIPFPPGNKREHPPGETTSPLVKIPPQVYAPITRRFVWGEEVVVTSENVHARNGNCCIIYAKVVTAREEAGSY